MQGYIGRAGHKAMFIDTYMYTYLLRTQSSIQNAVSAPATVSFKDVIEKMVISHCIAAAIILHHTFTVHNPALHRPRIMEFSLCQYPGKRDMKANCCITLVKLHCLSIEEWCL